MGLGPCVCQHCQVLAEYVSEGVPSRLDGRLQYHICPICGETDVTDSSGFNPTRMKMLLENERVLRFIVNKVEPEEY